MSRSKKLYLLVGVLAVICAVTFGVSRYEERKEQIKNSDEVVMELDSDTVTALSWSYEEESLAFHKDEEWMYDDDEAFPVSEEKINELLEVFESFGVSFIIEDVEDYGQYGLDDPVCTISISTEEEDYEIQLGDYSTMDEERYVSIGDGKVYLVQEDPLETYELELKDMIQNDEIPKFDTVTEITFEGSQDYEAVYNEDNKVTYSDEDVYFVKDGDQELPLDTENVENYVQTVSGLDLSEYVSYNVAEEELETYGLDEPELSVTLQYETEEEETEEMQEGSVTINISRDPKELPEESKEAKEDEDAEETSDSDDSEEDITAYLRVGDSKIIYKISGTDYETLMASAYDDLRHQNILWADFADIYQVDITLEGEDYTLKAKGEDEDGETIWHYDGDEIEIDDFKNAVTSLNVSGSTETDTADKEEIRLKVYLDNENEPEVEIELYRYDGKNCLAIVDGENIALIDRECVVELVEAVNAIVLD